MRVALVNPRFRLPIDTRTTAHLGLAYLAAVSERRGDEVVVFDADVEKQSIADFVLEFQPDIVGISIPSMPQMLAAMTLAYLVKQTDLPIHVTIGGPHVSMLREQLVKAPAIWDLIDSAWSLTANRRSSV